MRKLRTFKCTECGCIQNRFAEDDAKQVECKKCLEPAEITLSAPKYFGNSVGRSPSALS